jgi:ATP-dependent Clp protease ATP-binding subunit ClpA
MYPNFGDSFQEVFMEDTKSILRSQELSESIDHAYATARSKRQQFVTADDLIVAMLEKSQSLPAMLQAHQVDPLKLRESVTAWIDTSMKRLDGKDEVQVHPMPNFNRVIDRAETNVRVDLKANREVFCVDVLAAMFKEGVPSLSIRLLKTQNLKRQDVEKYAKTLPRQ